MTFLVTLAIIWGNFHVYFVVYVLLRHARRTMASASRDTGDQNTTNINKSEILSKCAFCFKVIRWNIDPSSFSVEQQDGMVAWWIKILLVCRTMCSDELRLWASFLARKHLHREFEEKSPNPPIFDSWQKLFDRQNFLDCIYTSHKNAVGEVVFKRLYKGKTPCGDWFTGK